MVLENRGKVDLDSTIHDIRCKAMASFEETGFPTKNDEEWTRSFNICYPQDDTDIAELFYALQKHYPLDS